MSTTNDNNTATLLHLSTLSQYFIPFGNFILPIIIWSSKKDKSEYIDKQGKECINFQLSLFTYTLLLALIVLPIFFIVIMKQITISDYNRFDEDGEFLLRNISMNNNGVLIAIAVVALLLFVFLKVAEFFLIIFAALKTSSGENFKYPITIRFLK